MAPKYHKPFSSTIAKFSTCSLPPLSSVGVSGYVAVILCFPFTLYFLCGKIVFALIDGCASLIQKCSADCYFPCSKSLVHPHLFAKATFLQAIFWPVLILYFSPILLRIPFLMIWMLFFTFAVIVSFLFVQFIKLLRKIWNAVSVICNNIT